MSQWRIARLKFRAVKSAGAKSTSGNHRDADWSVGTKVAQSLRMAALGKQN
jgi:hypothetical protein